MNKLSELMNLQGRRAMLTGANGALGKIIAETLADLGCNLLLLDRNGSDFTTLLSSLSTNSKVDVVTLECDLEDEAERQSMIQTVKADGLGLDVLINNAAFVGSSNLQGWSCSFEDQTLEAWRRAIEVNLTAVFHLCQSFAPELRSTCSGTIINVASIYGELGPDWTLYEGTNMGNPAAYAASKGGVIQLTRWLSTTMAPEVRVNAISPGGIFRNQPNSFVERYCKKTPLARMATESDFRGVIAFLATDMSRYVTGQNLMVDGGWSSW